MEENIAIFLSCIGFLFLEAVISQSDKKHSCRQFIENEVSVANCRQQPNLRAVPQDLDPNIRKLDLSANSLSDLAEDQFKRYAKLEVLKLSAMKTSFTKSYYYVFRQLKSLKTLELNFSRWWLEDNKIDPVFYWPPKLTTLNVVFLSDEDNWYLDLSNLEYLERLDASQNDIQIFPSFHHLAPLKYLNLNKTNLTRVRAEDLAPLCHLEELHLMVIYSAQILTAEKYCECKRLQVWINDKNIKGPKLECRFRNENCDLNFSEDLSMIYEKCLSRNKFPIYLKIIIILVILIIIMIGVVVGYLHRREMMAEIESPE